LSLIKTFWLTREPHCKMQIAKCKLQNANCKMIGFTLYTLHFALLVFPTSDF
jgi:hypothetical protein